MTDDSDNDRLTELKGSVQKRQLLVEVMIIILIVIIIMIIQH
jgi:hypothetical protein